MQSKPLKFNPICGTQFSSQTPVNVVVFRPPWAGVWYFNPWTGGLRASEDVKSDPQGLLIHDGESPIGAYTATELKADFAAGVARLVADTPAAAREAMHDAAEREPVHVTKPANYTATDSKRDFDEGVKALLAAHSGSLQPPPAGHPLHAVFALAIEQATRGKGVRHGGEATPFLDQPWAHYGKMHGRGFLTGQAAKKLEEAASTRTGEVFITEALGALVYIGMAILKEQGRV